MTLTVASLQAYINAHRSNKPGYCLEYWYDAVVAAGGATYPANVPNAESAAAKVALTSTAPHNGFAYWSDPAGGDVVPILAGVVWATDQGGSGKVNETTISQRDAELRSLHGSSTVKFLGYSTHLLNAAFADAAPAPAPASGNLQTGSTGSAVKTLQAGLNKVFPAYSKLTVDGVYGPATKAVVVEFQHRVGITPDGIVGPVTRAQLAKYGIHV